MSILLDERLEQVRLVVAGVARRHAVELSPEPDRSLVDQGLTSTAMVELMLAIEQAFDLTLPDGDLTADNFYSLATLVTLLARLEVLATGKDIPQLAIG